MALEFEWDPHKAARNVQKHGVAFEEAATVFRDPLSLTIADPAHSLGEERLVIFGMSVRDRVLAVMHTDQAGRIRIVSAREATRRERGAYEEGTL
jgi:uncharacterized DUF497 family protein